MFPLYKADLFSLTWWGQSLAIGEKQGWKNDVKQLLLYFERTEAAPLLVLNSVSIFSSSESIMSNLIIRTMEPNCCIFPSPKESKFGVNITRILLVPHNKEKQCTYYHQKYLLKQESQSNEFLMFCSKRKTRAMNHSSATTKEESEITKKGEYIDLKSKSSVNSRNFMSQTHLLMTEKQRPHELNQIEEYIPCLFLPGLRTDKILVFFHGNGEDISSAFQFASFISAELKLSIIIMEYRGYSVYAGSPNPATIVQDGARLIQFLHANGFEYESMIFFGRSIGGAIAFEVASKFPICSLILLSPFVSLKKIVEDLYGNCASNMIKETLDNHSVAPKVKSPVLIIHGLKDTLVPFQHSISILGQCKGYSRLKLIPNMTHIKFNFRYDFLIPLKTFLQDLKIMPT